MSLEDLSSENAQTNEKRMTDEVKKSFKIAHPPRLEPPMSSRESLVQKYSEEDETEPNMAMQEDTHSMRPPVATVSPPLLTDVDAKTKRVQLVMKTLHELRGDFYFYTTPKEQSFVRMVTAKPTGIGLKSVYTSPHLTLLLACMTSFLVGVYIKSDKLLSEQLPLIPESYRQSVNKMLKYA